MIEWLFDIAGFFPRSHCGPSFTPGLILSSKIANLIIFLSYTSIPVSLIYLWLKRRRDVSSPYIVILFAHFIMFCGITHLDNFLSFNYPAYRFFVLMEILTAIASFMTATILPFTITHLMKLPSFMQLQHLYDTLNELNVKNEAEIARRIRIETECSDHNQKLRLQVEKLEAELKHQHWLGEKYQALEELKNMLQKDLHESL